jgi:hypothetical protein
MRHGTQAITAPGEGRVFKSRISDLISVARFLVNCTQSLVAVRVSFK